MDCKDLDDWGIIWLEAWIECCDKSLANFLLAVEFGTEKDAHIFFEQFKRAKQCAIENMKDKRNDLLRSLYGRMKGLNEPEL